VLTQKKASESASDSVSTSERKTGLYVPNVETVGLVRDERDGSGWGAESNRRLMHR